MNKFIAFVLYLVFAAPIAMLNGVVLSDIWGWFIVPALGAPDITWLQAVGVAIVAGYFKMNLKGEDVDVERDSPIIRVLAKMIGFSAALLVVWSYAAVWSLFIPG